MTFENSSSENSQDRTSDAPKDFALTLDPENFPLDRYKPISELGKGSAGIVYRCLDPLLDKDVAIKCLRSVTAEQLMGFQAEAKATSLLKHIGVVAVLDFGVTSSGAPYMVMEYAAGETLEQRLKEKGPLSPSLAIKVFLRIAQALEYAHSKGVFHRDLKSSNILILDENSNNPDVRLIDFGVARLKHAIQATTAAQGTTIVGTPAYMPPDQAAGLTYDARSEVYALGCTMFEALTGRTPFVGATALETIAMHAHEQIPTLADTRRDMVFSDDLEAIVQTCLAKNKEDRFAEMSNLVAALSTLESGGSLSDNATSGYFKPGNTEVDFKSVRRPKKFLLLTLVAVAVLASAVVIYLVIPEQSNKTVDSGLDSDSGVESDYIAASDYATEYTALPSKATVRLNPKSVQLSERAWKLLASNSTKDAQSLCSDALAIDKNNLRALDVKAIAKLMEGKLDEACQDLTNSIGRRGVSQQEDAATFFYRGIVFRELGERNASRIDFREARVLGGYKPEAWEVKRFSLANNSLPIKQKPGEPVVVGKGLEHKGGNYKIVNGNDDEITALFDRQNPPVKELYLRGGTYSGETLAKIADIPSMRGLELAGVEIKDKDLKFLRECKSLEKLEIAHCDQITGSCLKYTQGLKHLLFIQFKDGKLDEQNFEYLENLNSLSAICLQGCPGFTGRGISHLPDSIERIDWLASSDKDFDSCKVDYSQRTFDRFARLPNLDVLALSADVMDDTVFSALSKLKKLRSVVLCGTKPLRPRSIEYLKDLPNLGRIECRDVTLDSDAVEKIGLCKKVHTLLLSGANLSPKSLTTLVGLPIKIKRLTLDQPNIDRKMVLELEKMKTLRHVVLRQLPVEVGTSTIAKLKHALPACRIEAEMDDGHVIQLDGQNNQEFDPQAE